MLGVGPGVTIPHHIPIPQAGPFPCLEIRALEATSGLTLELFLHAMQDDAMGAGETAWEAQGHCGTKLQGHCGTKLQGMASALLSGPQLGYH